MICRVLALVLLGWIAACAGCQLVRTHPVSEPFPYTLTRQQLVIHSDAPLDRQQRLVRDLAEQRDIINTKLGLAPTTNLVHVYLYANEQAYRQFMELRFPEMAERRAIFVGTDAQLSVYAYWGDHLAEDLRHEVSHGYLHAAMPNLPLWLDEGLAEYFEVGRGQRGFNESHIELLSAQVASDSWQPEIERLEALSSVVDMSQQDYAESWAWVHFLLESEDKSAVLTDYLTDLAHGNPTEPLSRRLRKRLAGPQVALVEHVRLLR